MMNKEFDFFRYFFLSIWENRRLIITGIVTLSVLILIMYFAFAPSNPKLAEDGVDKILHVLGFAALILPFSIFRPRAMRRLIIIILIIGGTIEIVQSILGRTGDILDFIADIFGIILGIIIAHVILFLISKFSPAKS